MTAYSLLLGSSAGLGNPATAYVTLSTPGAYTGVTIPTGYNALHVQYAVGGGGGATSGLAYSSANGESSGVSGASGGAISDLIFQLTTQMVTLDFVVGFGGASSNTPTSSFDRTAQDGGQTEITAKNISNTTLNQFFAFGGKGGKLSGGSNSSLSTATLPSGGSVSFNFQRYQAGDGSFLNSSRQLIAIGNVAELQGGPVGTFNSLASGQQGFWNGNCTGNNCRIGGATGGSSYASTITGGTGGSSAGAGTNGSNGTRGSGGGGGAAQVSNTNGFTDGGFGGNGEIRYRFLDVF